MHAIDGLIRNVQCLCLSIEEITVCITDSVTIVSSRTVIDPYIEFSD